MDKWMRPHNELLPQTREAWIASWQKRVGEWEQLFREEEEYPTSDEAARARSESFYRIALMRLEECINGE